MTGRILKGIGGFYTVLADTQYHTCKARGRFRKDGATPVPGDMVLFEPGQEGEGYLLEILPRKNLLQRPMVANLDKLLIVLSASRPGMDLNLCDKLLFQCESKAIVPVILCNKVDEEADGALDRLLGQYGPAGYSVYGVSAKTGAGIAAIQKEMEGCISCFAGQSAVGKSSLLNAILPGLKQEVGDVSRKTERGRHTTRHAELFPAFGGAVVDTPGFSLLDMRCMEPEDLSALYPEMAPLRKDCRYPACLHISEPGCAVKPLLDKGGLHPARHERYRSYIQELKEMRKHRYD